MMVEQEGVVKYRLTFTDAEPPVFSRFAELNYWRCYLYRLGMIGQDPQRYDGLGYGNISSRLKSGDNAFLISATQTGHMPLLCRDYYALVSGFDLARNQLIASGHHKPSSEALTHASIYACRDDINCVMHIHCPRLWSRARELDLACTPPSIAYGTPEMGQAVQGLVSTSVRPKGVIAMLGHLDGMLIYGADEEDAGMVLNDLLQHGSC